MTMRATHEHHGFHMAAGPFGSIPDSCRRHAPWRPSENADSAEFARVGLASVGSAPRFAQAEMCVFARRKSTAGNCRESPQIAAKRRKSPQTAWESSFQAVSGSPEIAGKSLFGAPPNMPRPRAVGMSTQTLGRLGQQRVVPAGMWGLVGLGAGGLMAQEGLDFAVGLGETKGHVGGGAWGGGGARGVFIRR